MLRTAVGAVALASVLAVNPGNIGCAPPAPTNCVTTKTPSDRPTVGAASCRTGWYRVDVKYWSPSLRAWHHVYGPWKVNGAASVAGIPQADFSAGAVISSVVADT